MSVPVTLYSPDGRRSRQIAAIDAPGWIKAGWLKQPPVILSPPPEEPPVILSPPPEEPPVIPPTSIPMSDPEEPPLIEGTQTKRSK